MQISCLIVDDERLVRVALRHLLKGFPGVKILGEAESVEDAVAQIRAREPDFVFLDIEMPGADGFEIFQQLETPPAVVFMTAHAEYAAHAFDLQAIDYLLKPVSPERMAQALERVEKNRALEEGGPVPEESQILCEIGSTDIFLPRSDILSIESDGNYTVVTSESEKKTMVRQTLTDWEQQLPSESFARLDRGIMLNISAIASVELQGRSAIVRLGSDHEITLGPSAATRLRKLLQAL